jgi:thymidylate kinase
MIILLEGPDGAGKSTLRNELIRVHAEEGRGGSAIWNRGPFTAEHSPWAEYAFDLLQLTPNPDWLVVMDRWHLGELVYGPLLRGASRLSLAQARWLDSLLRDRGALYVHLYAPSPTLMKRLAERGDDLIDPHLLPKINNAYCGLFQEVFWMTPGPKLKTINTDLTRASAIAPALLASARMEAIVALSRLRHPSTKDQRPYEEMNPWPT